MKRKLLVIFFIAIISSLLIYGRSKKNYNSVLYIGEKEYLNRIKYQDYNIFLYDNITYKQLINSIKHNDYIVIKNKKVFLNQLIKESNTIIIYANNIEYNKKCNKKNININNYNNSIIKSKKELINILKRITSSKIIIIDNKCKKESNS